MILNCGGRALDLRQAVVMGILNQTPDSFSDGGAFTSVQAVVDRAGEMLEQGARILDVGGESTRPGADEVPADVELDRVIPVIEALAGTFGVPISIDTSKAEVARAAVAAGAGMINDVCALRGEGMLQAAVDLNVPVCLMHMQGQPRSMQSRPEYVDVVEEVGCFLQARIDTCLAAGIDSNKLVIDPGFGFGKSLEHNLRLMKFLSRLCDRGYPVLVGVSRKSMIGDILGAEVNDRLFGGLALSTLAIWQGASILRVHDVAPTIQALKTCQAVRSIN